MESASASAVFVESIFKIQYENLCRWNPELWVIDAEVISLRCGGGLFLCFFKENSIENDSMFGIQKIQSA